MPRAEEDMKGDGVTILKKKPWEGLYSNGTILYLNYGGGEASVDRGDKMT